MKIFQTKSIKIIFPLVMITIFQIVSCKKEIISPEISDPARAAKLRELLKEGATVKEISYLDFLNKADFNRMGEFKNSFKVISGKESLMTQNLSLTPTILGNRELNTNTIKVLKARGHTSYIFFVVNPSLPSNQFENITIDESSFGTQIFISTYTPTENWIRNRNAGIAQNFDGSVKNTRVNSDGTIATSMGMEQKTFKSSAAKQERLSLYNFEDCITTYELQPYLCSSGLHTPWEECTYTYPDYYGDGTPPGFAWVPISDSGCTGGGGGGQTTPLSPPQSGGGNSGNSQPNLANRDIIIDPNARPCVTTIKNDLLAAANITSIVQTMLNYHKANNMPSFNAANAMINLNAHHTIHVNESTALAYNVQTPQGLYTIGGITNQNGEIFLNKYYLNDATNLAVAATFLHELMHSYFSVGANNSTGNEQIGFNQLNYFLFDASGLPLPVGSQLNTTQHQAMALLYIDSMAQVLKTYATNNNISVPPGYSGLSLVDYCRDLLWGSLEKGSGLTPPNKPRVDQITGNERTNGVNSTNKGMLTLKFILVTLVGSSFLGLEGCAQHTIQPNANLPLTRKIIEHIQPISDGYLPKTIDIDNRMIRFGYYWALKKGQADNLKQFLTLESWRFVQTQDTTNLKDTGDKLIVRDFLSKPKATSKSRYYIQITSLFLNSEKNRAYCYFQLFISNELQYGPCLLLAEKQGDEWKVLGHSYSLMY